jgi:glycosyltransferase involved in cell wall biosynthesis
MTVRDGAAHLGDAVRSVQAQSYARWELIVVDDGSRDDSAAIATQFAVHDNRIRIVSVSPRGRAAAANLGVDLAEGPLLARLDADDIAVPERLSLQVRWMQLNDVALCGGWALAFGDRTDVWWVPDSHGAIARELLVGYPLVNSATLARTEVMRAHRYDEGYACEDQELWGRLAVSHRLGNLPALLVKYRCHPGQATRREKTRLLADHRLCRRRLFGELFPDAPSREAEALDRLAEVQPCSSQAELADVGAVLARLARGADPPHRLRMLERWRYICRQTEQLGINTEDLYRRVAPELGVAAADGWQPSSTWQRTVRLPVGRARRWRHERRSADARR